MEPEDPRLAAAARHALHDEELVAAYAVDGEASDDPARARALIERCSTCRDLHADLVAIGSAVRAAGTAEAVGAIRPAARDFRLTASDAARLRGGGVLQRVVARVVDGVAAFGRPVGASLAALGVVGLLVGTMTLGFLGGAASMTTEGTGAQAPAATLDATAGVQPLATSATDRFNPGPQSTDARQELTGNGTDADNAGTGPSTTPWLFAGSFAVLVAGVALLLAGTRQRRRPIPRPADRT
jgi:hypothetical protein